MMNADAMACVSWWSKELYRGPADPRHWMPTYYVVWLACPYDRYCLMAAGADGYMRDVDQDWARRVHLAEASEVARREAEATAEA